MRIGLLSAEGEGFTGPGPSAFEYPAIFSIAGYEINKPIVQLFFSVLVISVFFIFVARRMQLVPGKVQFAAESVYFGVRNSIGRDVIGGQDYAKYVPLLVSLFTFIYLNNLFGIVPLIQFPTMARIAFPVALATIVWVVYNAAGIRRKGWARYSKDVVYIPGLPVWIYPLLIPIEFVSNILVRPLTLSLRLFANMFAGHLLLLVFILGGEYMLLESEALLPKLLSPFAFGMAIVMTFFEALVQLLQAYIFTLLTALYIQGALAEEH